MVRKLKPVCGNGNRSLFQNQKVTLLEGTYAIVLMIMNIVRTLFYSDFSSAAVNFLYGIFYQK